VYPQKIKRLSPFYPIFLGEVLESDEEFLLFINEPESGVKIS